MADGVPITAGTGTTIATDDCGSPGHAQIMKLAISTDGSATLIPAEATNGLDVDVTRVPADPYGVNADAASASGSISAKLREIATNGVVLKAGTAVVGQVYGAMVTVATDVTRPADTTAYAINDALSDSTSAPTTGGFTFTSAARTSGGSGVITDATICTAADQGTLLQGEIMIFNQAVTNINDNSAFAITDAEAKTLIGKIPFTLEDIGNNGWFHAQNLSIGFTCVGTANLRFLIRVKNAYTPISAEVFTFTLKIMQVN